MSAIDDGYASDEEVEEDNQNSSHRTIHDLAGISIGPSRTPTDFFAVTQALIDDPSPSLPHPF